MEESRRKWSKNQEEEEVEERKKIVMFYHLYKRKKSFDMEKSPVNWGLETLGKWILTRS